MNNTYRGCVCCTEVLENSALENRIAQTADPQLVDRALFMEQVEHAPDLVVVGGRQIQPRE